MTDAGKGLNYCQPSPGRGANDTTSSASGATSHRQNSGRATAPFHGYDHITDSRQHHAHGASSRQKRTLPTMNNGRLGMFRSPTRTRVKTGRFVGRPSAPGPQWFFRMVWLAGIASLSLFVIVVVFFFDSPPLALPDHHAIRHIWHRGFGYQPCRGG